MGEMEDDHAKYMAIAIDQVKIIFILAYLFARLKKLWM